MTQMDQMGKLLAKRRDKAIAVILSCKERECDGYLPVEVQARLRKVVLDQLNDLTDLAVDLLGSSDGKGMIINELFLEKLDAVYEAVVK